MEDFVIGVDVDDVLASFTADALRRLEKHCDQSFTVDDVHTWDPFDSLPEEVRQFRDVVYNEMKQEGACFALPVERGAAGGIESPRTIGHVVAITHPFKNAKTWVHERELWLEQHFGMHRDDIYSCKKKYRIHVDVFIDDKLENVQQWRKFHDSDDGILWGTPMNRYATGLPRYTDWAAAARLAAMVKRLKKR